jgi:D-serine deaminase-like pyridoxal phosphate-dependent protein
MIDDKPMKSMLTEFPWNERYRISNLDDLLSPALVLYPEIIASNIDRTVQLLGGNADRWRVHIKTSKLACTLRMLVDRGVRNFKCATTLELLVGCQSGATDILVAYPMVGANARRVREIAGQFPSVRISVLVENQEQLRQWISSSVGIFLDINPGMNRTGVEADQAETVVRMIGHAAERGLEFRGLHYYDGQYGEFEERERTAAAHAGYDTLLALVAEIRCAGLSVPEIITAGTPTFPSSLTYQGFHEKDFIHRVSPGTIVYCDATSLAQLPGEWDYAPAALAMSRVVSRPHQGIITCDAGHKTVSADAGVPTCVVVGHPELTALSPSEEHLPMQSKTSPGPAIGDALYLLPRHICPTVNNFDYALIVRERRIESVEKVSARGRETPMLESLAASSPRSAIAYRN